MIRAVGLNEINPYIMPKILIIDDDTEFTRAVCATLKRHGYDVVEASGGKEGMDLYTQNPADLVITDILMPDLDGMEVIFHLSKSFPGVKIIAISGGGQFGTAGDYLSLTGQIRNVRCTLSKPFSKDQLFEAVDRVLA